MKTEAQIEGMRDIVEDVIEKEAKTEKQKLADILLKLPEDIKALELGILERKEKMEGTERILGLMEMQVQAQVLDETMPDGKPKHSNESKRQAEIKIRMSQMQEYKAAKEQEKSEASAIKRMEIGLKYRINQFSAYKKIADIVAGRIQ